MPIMSMMHNIGYTKDAVKHSELFGITVTNDTADDSVTDSSGRHAWEQIGQRLLVS